MQGDRIKVILVCSALFDEAIHQLSTIHDNRRGGKSDNKNKNPSTKDAPCPHPQVWPAQESTSSSSATTLE
jgi:hypothetical protein